MTIKHCANPLRHVPRVHTLQAHHVLPQSWGGKEGEKVSICGSCHDNVHALLNEYVHHTGRPPGKVMDEYDTFIRGIAAKAWAKRPSDKPPYTVSVTVQGV